MAIVDHNIIGTVSEFIKFWTPLITAGSLLLAIYRKANKRITSWANTLMGNHMHHLQSSLDRIEAAQSEQLEHTSVQTDQMIAQTVLLQQIAADLHDKR